MIEIMVLMSNTWMHGPAEQYVHAENQTQLLCYQHDTSCNTMYPLLYYVSTPAILYVSIPAILSRHNLCVVVFPVQGSPYVH